MSWPSTIEYDRAFNAMVQAKLGGYHSADLLIRSIDYHRISTCYLDAWDETPASSRRTPDDGGDP